MITVKALTVADLHQSKKLYEQLEQAVRWHTPDLVAVVGDCLDLWDAGGQELSREECARRLVALACKDIVFVRGNHESEGWAAFVTAWRRCGRMRMLHALHEEAFVSGPLGIVGFPCLMGDDFHYLEGRESTQGDYSDKWLERVVRVHGSSARTLWLMHQPPAGTRICKDIGPMSGVARWREAIERHSPLLTISGHDHNTPGQAGFWWDKIGQTVCVNVGQKLDGPLHYCVIEFTFAKPTPCLPSRILVSAYPWDQSVEIAPVGSAE